MNSSITIVSFGYPDGRKLTAFVASIASSYPIRPAVHTLSLVGAPAASMAGLQGFTEGVLPTLVGGQAP